MQLKSPSNSKLSEIFLKRYASSLLNISLSCLFAVPKGAWMFTIEMSRKLAAFAGPDGIVVMLVSGSVSIVIRAVPHLVFPIL